MRQATVRDKRCKRAVRVWVYVCVAESVCVVLVWLSGCEVCALIFCGFGSSTRLHSVTFSVRQRFNAELNLRGCSAHALRRRNIAEKSQK